MNSMMMPRFVLAAIAALVAGCAAADQPPGAAYEVTASLPGPDGRWDYASFDAASGQVFVSHGTEVLIYDPAGTAAPRSVGTIEGAHASLAVPGSKLLLVTSGKDDSLRLLDLATGQEVARIAVGKDPDAAAIDADGKTAYVMNAKDGSVSLIDLQARKETGRISLKPGLEGVVQISPRLLAVNNEDLNEIELADLDRGSMDGTIAMPGCTGPSGIAYDPLTQLAMSSCDNGKAALVDIAQRRLVRLLDIGAGPDTVLFDAARHRFIVPCGQSGSVSLFDVSGAGEVTPLASLASETGARTAALDPASGRIFLPTSRFLAAPAGKRPPSEPGTFHLLVLMPHG